MSTEPRLRELGIDLPDIPPPIADGYIPKFAPWVRSGGHIFLSGRLAKTGDQLLVGKVGADIALGAAKSAARDVAIELLGVLKAAVGDLDHVSQVARMLVMVNGAPGFNEPHRIADGASELLLEVFGERGLHARSALVAADLPFGAALEIDLVVEVAVGGVAMPITATRDVLIQAPDLAAARTYYEGVLGLAVFMTEPDILGFEAGALRLFVEKRPAFGPVLEFLVDDLAAAKGRLVAAGCRLIEEDPSIPRLYLADPFGLVFNVGRRNSARSADDFDVFSRNQEASCRWLPKTRIT